MRLAPSIRVHRLGMTDFRRMGKVGLRDLLPDNVYLVEDSKEPVAVLLSWETFAHLQDLLQHGPALRKILSSTEVETAIAFRLADLRVYPRRDDKVVAEIADLETSLADVRKATHSHAVSGDPA